MIFCLEWNKGTHDIHVIVFHLSPFLPLAATSKRRHIQALHHARADLETSQESGKEDANFIGSALFTHCNLHQSLLAYTFPRISPNDAKEGQESIYDMPQCSEVHRSLRFRQLWHGRRWQDGEHQ